MQLLILEYYTVVFQHCGLLCDVIILFIFIFNDGVVHLMHGISDRDDLGLKYRTFSIILPLDLYEITVKIIESVNVYDKLISIR
jgi:hypothetical protein